MSPQARKNENTSFCKPKTGVDENTIHTYLQVDPDKDLNDFNATEVCKMGKAQPQTLVGVCPESQREACTRDASCLLQVFNDDKNAETSACFCPSSQGSSISACQVDLPDLFSTLPIQTNETSSNSASASSPTMTLSPSPDINGSSAEPATGDSRTSSGGPNLSTSNFPQPTDDGASSLRATPSTLSTSNSASSHKLSVPIIVGAIVGGLVFLLLLIGVFLYFRRRKRKLHVPPSAEFLERGYGTRTPQPALFDGQRDSAAELLPDYDRGAAINPPFEKESEVVVASPEGYGVGHGLNKRQ